MRRSYLSGLGVMGRRHLVGLASHGYLVEAFDPSASSRNEALRELERRGLGRDLLHFVEGPSGHYIVAIFSEHADLRFANVESFLGKSSGERFLLEKPLSSNPDEVDRYFDLFARHGVKAPQVVGNFSRRSWSSSAQIKALADSAQHITMTVHGGAFGFGSNGIHHLDYFLFLTDRSTAQVRYARLFDTLIASGRGERFHDFGGQFVVENDRGIFSSLCVPTASVAPVLVIAGQHFVATIDERNLEWTLAVRKAESNAPLFRCGFDYEVLASGAMECTAMDQVSGLWAEGRITLPDLSQALASHKLLHSVLEAAGAPLPYRYT
jgi:hypothetical protein